VKYLPLLTLLVPLTAHAELNSQVGAQVRIDGQVHIYSDDQDKTVPIPLPTNRFTCVRKPIMTTAASVIVFVTCLEGTHEAFVIGAGCSRNQPEEHESVVAVNISKTDKPLIATFTVGCRTVQGMVTL
jgi:hypothetical protein